MAKPIVIDLFCGLGGWTKGFLAEGYEAVGFDIERHVYGEKRYPGQLVLQDVCTLDGRQFRGAAVIVASPPCQQYSLLGMRMFYPNPPSPDKRLWEAAVRIGEQAGVPLIIENVRGAQYCWGRARWKSGPYYLWGDVPALWPDVPLKRKNLVDDVKNGVRRGLQVNSKFSSNSRERAELTALAAEIPFDLSQWIARCFKPIHAPAVAESSNVNAPCFRD